MLVEARESNVENDGKYFSRKGCEFYVLGSEDVADDLIQRESAGWVFR